MKGMWNVLERAGLVRNEGLDTQAGAVLRFDESMALASSEGNVAAPSDSVPASVEDVSGTSLAQIYASASIAQAPYPAERLLRLLDGLRAMDEGTRRQAIQAMDAADDGWTIDDPVDDAAAKVSAIEAHAALVRDRLAQAESDARAENEKRRQQHQATVTDIQRQIRDLEGLLSREIARCAQESAALDAAVQAKVESVARELGMLSRVSSDFRSLVAQFSTGAAKSNPPH